MQKQKISNNGKASSQRKTSGLDRKQKLLIVFISIFLFLSIALGAVLGIIAAVRDSKAAVKYEGVVIDTKVASFLATYYKYYFMINLGVENVEDTLGFWNSEINDGSATTYGELLEKSTKEYISNSVAASYLFDNSFTYSAEDKEKVQKAIDSIIEYKADGSISKFNEAVEKYGFDYEAFKEGAKIIYKSDSVRDLFLANDGSAVASDTAYLESYLAQYSHVKILYIKTENTFVIDENGNKTVDENGNYLTRPLTEPEKEKRLALIEEVRELISGYENDSDVGMSPTGFDNFIASNGEIEENMEDGYYFHENALYTQQFPIREVVNKSYEMEIKEYAEVVTDEGVFFLYKDYVTQGIYATDFSQDCFYDFYTDAAAEFFSDTLLAISSDVVFTELYDEVDIRKLPYNYVYIPKF